MNSRLLNCSLKFSLSLPSDPLIAPELQNRKSNSPMKQNQTNLSHQQLGPIFIARLTRSLYRWPNRIVVRNILTLYPAMDVTDYENPRIHHPHLVPVPRVTSAAAECTRRPPTHFTHDGLQKSTLKPLVPTLWVFLAWTELVDWSWILQFMEKKRVRGYSQSQLDMWMLLLPGVEPPPKHPSTSIQNFLFVTKMVTLANNPIPTINCEQQTKV